MHSAPLQYTPARWMQFVDGENVTIRAQSLLQENKIPLAPFEQYKPDCLIVPGQAVNIAFGTLPQHAEPFPIRSFYYTSLTGDDPCLQAVRGQLRALGFEPHVFKKESRQIKAKGVDIELTTDMLSHAFRGNYEVAVLIAGDGDYVPLVEQVKRLGKRVHVKFIERWVNVELKLAADSFTDISELILNFAKRKASEPKL